MKIFLLDDEKGARDTILSYLNKYPFTTLPEVKQADGIESGLDTLRSFDPDIAFLDINLQGGTSFDMLGRLDEIRFKIVFVSAYDSYAIKAFKFNALDYILKPINPVEFNAALDKVVANLSPTSRPQLEQLNLNLSGNELKKIVLKDAQSIYFVEVDQIIQCRSENNYTVFSLLDGTEIMISKTLGEYEEVLKEKGFFRSHRSHLVNLQQVKKYNKREGGFIEMNNNEQVPLARNKKDIFLKLVDLIR